MEQSAKDGRSFTDVLCQLTNLAVPAQLFVPHRLLPPLTPLHHLTVLLNTFSLNESLLLESDVFLDLNGVFVQ